MDREPSEITSKHILLPLFYFFSLSFGLLFLAVYWLANGTGDTTQSYAQIILNPHTNNEMKDVEGCDYGIAEKIDSFFKKHKAPLAGHGCTFTITASNSGIDPLIAPAIAWCESNGGKVTPQFRGQESYNAWGWAVFEDNEITKDVNGYGSDSWAVFIGRVNRGIVRNAEKRGLGTKPKEIVRWYNPGSVRRAGGDPANATWTKCVESTMKKISEL